MQRPRVLAISQGRIPTVELAGIYPFTWLAEAGDCEFKYRDAGDVLADDLLWCDVLYVIRGGSERIHMIVKEVHALGRVVIAYWDDDPFCVPESSSSHGSFAAMLPRITQIMQQAQLAVCSTGPCAAAFKKATGREVHVLSSCPVINPIDTWDARTRKDSGTLFGYAGSTDHWPVVESIIFPALEILLKRKVVFTCEIMGPSVKVPAHLKECVVLCPPLYNYQQWIEARNSLQWNFALAPLQPSLFNRSKTPNKFLEYSAAGIPCIFSNVEPYTLIVSNNLSGLLSENNAAAWADAISTLLHNTALTEKLAQNAWEKVVQDFGREKIVHGYKQLLEQFPDCTQARGIGYVKFYNFRFSVRMFWHLLSWRTFHLKVMNLCSRIRRAI